VPGPGEGVPGPGEGLTSSCPMVNATPAGPGPGKGVTPKGTRRRRGFARHGRAAGRDVPATAVPPARSTPGRGCL